MASNFFKAMKDANLSVTARTDGSRQVGGNAYMDREDGRPSRGSYNYRGRSRGRSRGNRGRGSGGRYNSRPGRGYGGGVNPMSRFDGDGDDYSMDGGASSKFRYKPYGGRQSYGRGFNRDRNNDRQSFDSKWFKVSIPGGRHHDETWLISKLKGQVTTPFECVEFHCVGDSACFFVDDKEAADALKSKSYRITLSDGSKLAIHVRPSDPPRFTGGSGSGGGARRGESSSSFAPKALDSETEQILMNCLAQRYIVDSNSVNLSKLSEDTTLASNNIKINVNKPWLLSAFFDIIHKIQPELAGLDLSGNEIRSLDALRNAPEKLPKLKVLSLKNNEIQNLEDLERLNSMESLKHVLVEGNPLCLKYQGNLESLRRDVRSKLPTIETLDGAQLPPPILFDLPKSAPLPSAKVNYVPHPELQTKISQFIQQYFQVYDRDDRQGLLDFYHDQASLSLCVNSNVYSKEVSRERQHPLNGYFQISRNLKRLRDKAKRSSLIKHTKLAAVAFLNELPMTKHDLQSFALDVSMATAQFFCFTIRGYFFEGSARDVPRSFSRTFILLMSPDKSMKVINDQLHIRNPVKDVQKTEAASVATEAVSPQQGLLKLTTEQQELVKKFSAASKMNLNYSIQCLQENGWDFEKSGKVFTKLQAEGKIPPDAFTQ